MNTTYVPKQDVFSFFQNISENYILHFVIGILVQWCTANLMNGLSHSETYLIMCHILTCSIKISMCLKRQKACLLTVLFVI